MIGLNSRGIKLWTILILKKLFIEERSKFLAAYYILKQYDLLDEYERFRNAEPTFSEDKIVSVDE